MATITQACSAPFSSDNLAFVGIFGLILLDLKANKW